MAVKLFFIAGIPWMFEIFAWLTNFLLGDSASHQYVNYFFNISTTLNSLRGIVIFVLFVVLQRDTRHYLWNGSVKRLPLFKNKSGKNDLSKDKSGSTSNMNNQSTSGDTQISSVTLTSVVSDEQQPSENQFESDEVTQF